MTCTPRVVDARVGTRICLPVDLVACLCDLGHVVDPPRADTEWVGETGTIAPDLLIGARPGVGL